MLDFTPLFEAIITLLAAVITMYVVPWIKEKYTADQLYKIKAVVEIAVYAAEKAYGAGNGKEKFKCVERILEDYGIELDTARLNSLVDSTIKKMEQSEPWILEQGTEEETQEVG